ncbi:hypothetical protein BOW53_13645 [Solemya pervernicosa gill symbiont]|uniref:Uncharacterized protein n=2 Tax=Gammaproteobacteria incertae sedis TaxID=118884 RepID=A0A1T2L1K5_9GAMM|nr:hypothetical protein [Candidatus Reidiella endopervernicosa]OOZ38944.1 hypothetical protein BOW53_13645 [Solemya pervernicosa gill symbiont]QKQ26822.1 hypothetical protein HUE57_11415 [Candidatus Reidiella endopervernicosa]
MHSEKLCERCKSGSPHNLLLYVGNSHGSYDLLMSGHDDDCFQKVIKRLIEACLSFKLFGFNDDSYNVVRQWQSNGSEEFAASA